MGKLLIEHEAPLEQTGREKETPSSLQKGTVVQSKLGALEFGSGSFISSRS